MEASKRVDPDELLESWGVVVHDLDLGTPTVDAVAVWGPTRGPAVLVNPGGRHSQVIPGRRSTLAHEIAHLLIDRRGGLPLAEVLGGRVSRAVEARARAFAAELLLPRHVAGAALSATEDPGTALNRLCDDFGVSAELAAWQARNSERILPPDTVELLRRKVSDPDRY